MATTIKTKWLATSLLMSGLAVNTTSWAADNSIYIQQSGDNSTVSMTQDGAGNVVRGIQGVGTDNTTPALIVGNGNNVTVSQIGQGNTLDFGIQTSVQAGATNGNTYNYTISGNNSTAIIDSNRDNRNSSASNIVNVSQTGDYSNANVNVLGGLNNVSDTTVGGSHNSVVNTVNGNSNTQTVNVSNGGYNAITVNQGVGGSAASSPALVTTNNNGSATVTVVGASNTVNVQQTGSTNTTTVSLTGSSNTANVNQNAVTGNTVVSLVSVGNGNQFTISSAAH